MNFFNLICLSTPHFLYKYGTPARVRLAKHTSWSNKVGTELSARDSVMHWCNMICFNAMCRCVWPLWPGNISSMQFVVNIVKLCYTGSTAAAASADILFRPCFNYMARTFEIKYILATVFNQLTHKDILTNIN